MRFKLTTKNIDTWTRKLEAARKDIPDELRLAGVEAIELFHQETASYPPQPPYMGMRNYGVHVKTYRRTGTYGREQFANVRLVGPVVQATLETPTPYSIWLRGDLKGYPGAWMHTPFWKSLARIIQDNLPRAVAVLRARLSSYIRRMNS